MKKILLTLAALLLLPLAARAESELSLTLQNIFDPSHAEFGDPASRSELDRSAYAKLLWRF